VPPTTAPLAAAVFDVAASDLNEAGIVPAPAWLADTEATPVDNELMPLVAVLKPADSKLMSVDTDVDKDDS